MAVNQSIETSGLRMNPNLFGYLRNLQMKGVFFTSNRYYSRDREDPNQYIMDASYNELQELICMPCLEDNE